MSDQAEEFHTPDRQPFWHADLPPQPVEVIGELIRRNQNSCALFGVAAEETEEDQHQQLLQTMSERHEDFQTALIEQMVRLGGKPSGSSSFTDMLQQAWVKTESKLGASDKTLMRSCLDELEELVEAYTEAKKVDLPAAVARLIKEQFHEIAQERQQLEELVAQPMRS